MLVGPKRGLGMACVCLQLVACGGPEFGRIGPTVPLPNGGPSSACEREGWYELAPARVQAQGMTAGIGYNTMYFQAHEGTGVFEPESKDPEDIEDLLPRMKEPELERKHRARIDPVDDAATRSLWWALGGLAGFLGGVGTAAAIQKDSKTGAAVAGISGLVIGLVGIVGLFVEQPSGRDQLEADARRKLFIEGEDDPIAVARGTDRMNAARRQQCGGNPVPFTTVSPSAREPKSPPESASPPSDTPATPSSPKPAPETKPETTDFPPLKAGS